MKVKLSHKMKKKQKIWRIKKMRLLLDKKEKRNCKN